MINQTKEFQILQRASDLVYSMKYCPPTKRTKRKLFALKARLINIRMNTPKPQLEVNSKGQEFLLKYLQSK